MKKTKIEEKDNSVLIDIDSKLYDLNVVYNAAYNFLDRAYVVLDGDPEDVIKITLKAKEKSNKKTLEELAGNFFNELVGARIRADISNKNKAIREYIISADLIGASPELRKKIEQEHDVDSGGEDDDAWDDDPLGIAMSWEAKYKKENNNNGNN